MAKVQLVAAEVRAIRVKIVKEGLAQVVRVIQVRATLVRAARVMMILETRGRVALALELPVKVA